MNKNQGASGAATLMRRWLPTIAVLLVAELCFTNAAFAQNAVEEFYKGKVLGFELVPSTLKA